MGTSTDIFRPYSYIWTPISNLKPTNDDFIAPQTLRLGKRRMIYSDDQSSLGSPSKRQKAYDENQELRMGKKRGMEGGHDDGGFLKHRKSNQNQSFRFRFEAPQKHTNQAKTLADPKIGGTLFRDSVAETANASF